MTPTQKKHYNETFQMPERIKGNKLEYKQNKTNTMIIRDKRKKHIFRIEVKILKQIKRFDYRETIMEENIKRKVKVKVGNL